MTVEPRIDIVTFCIIGLTFAAVLYVLIALGVEIPTMEWGMK